MLNVLEERDVQIRGYKIRLPLDLMLVASANPEDYTNRGRIITPLKDRFGSQIRTHYPLEIDTEYAIMRQEARPLDIAAPADDRRPRRRPRVVPEYLGQVIATFSHLARASNHVNQRSGVSVRLSVANYEALAANALRRGLRSGERSVVARVDDLEALAASSIGKIEIESLEEGREGAIFENLVKGAVLTVFKDRVEPEQTRDVVAAFEEGAIAHTGEDVTSAQLAGLRRHRARVADAGAPSHRRRRVTGRGRRGRRVRARRPAPVEAPQQGRLRQPGDLPRPHADVQPLASRSSASHAEHLDTNDWPASQPNQAVPAGGGADVAVDEAEVVRRRSLDGWARRTRPRRRCRRDDDVVDRQAQLLDDAAVGVGIDQRRPERGDRQ